MSFQRMICSCAIFLLGIEPGYPAQLVVERIAERIDLKSRLSIVAALYQCEAAVTFARQTARDVNAKPPQFLWDVSGFALGILESLDSRSTHRPASMRTR
ncbi:MULTISPECIES: hypothetical protein [Silvimonas]|uniref:hypothetical protein n=1 Tax=Silvimonas TaxID=300264 RepID=UPI0024B32FFD|nr:MULTISPECIES: hypothetical protein [Silvimonas]MDR3426482.1 hypothetical protein [Silvimonas sp.]